MRFKSLFYSLFFISTCLTSCEFNCSIGDKTANERGKKYKPVKKEGTLLYNGIQLNSHNVKVKEAYLVHRDSLGSNVEEENIIDVNKGVKMLVLIDSGWKETENGVLLGASMKAVADNGQELVDMKDLFENNREISSKDSRIIGLSLFFNTWDANRPVTINVSFRIWDKNSSAYIDGTYTVHTK